MMPSWPGNVRSRLELFGDSKGGQTPMSQSEQGFHPTCTLGYNGGTGFMSLVALSLVPLSLVPLSPSHLGPDNPPEI